MRKKIIITAVILIVFSVQFIFASINRQDLINERLEEKRVILTTYSKNFFIRESDWIRVEEGNKIQDLLVCIRQAIRKEDETPCETVGVFAMSKENEIVKLTFTCG